jgi:hypothetical protein
MGLTGTFDKLITLIILGTFVLGIIETTTFADTEVPWYQSVGEDVESGDSSKLIDLIKMGISWGAITSAVPVSQLPLILQPYGWYYRIFVPEGYLPMPGIESTIFVFIVLLFVILPLAIYTKRQIKRRHDGKSNDFQLLGLPWWFYLSIPAALLLLYPLWIWFNIWMFAYGYAGFFGTTPEAGRAMWITLSQNTESFSIFFMITGGLGIYKTVVWSKKGKIGF